MILHGNHELLFELVAHLFGQVYKINKKITMLFNESLSLLDYFVKVGVSSDHQFVALILLIVNI
jgi:hypothetical protein